MPAEQWWVILDADGRPVSEGTVVADPLPSGLTKVKVGGPSNGRPWDPQAQAWGPAPAPPPPPAPDPNAAIVAALAVIAADPGKTTDEKVAGIIDVLAQAAPTA